MRVVIGEDQALLREGVVRLLEDAGFDVVAEAGDAPDLLRKVGAHKPDVAIVDVQMPPDNTDDGLRAALEIRARQPEVGVLVLSQHADERVVVIITGEGLKTLDAVRGTFATFEIKPSYDQFVAEVEGAEVRV